MFLSTLWKMLSSILILKLTPHVHKLTGVHRCVFRRNKSTTDLIFCIHQILVEKQKYNGTERQLYKTSRKPMTHHHPSRLGYSWSVSVQNI
jgi:hypothetical protein